MHSLSSAERLAVAGALLLVALHAAVVWNPAFGAAFEYRADAALSQPWRLLTCHLVHINWPHVLVNAVAWWVVARLFAPELSPRAQWAVLIVAAVVITAGLRALHPQIVWYRGFSGVLHAIFFAGAVTWLVTTVRDPVQRTRAQLWLPFALVVGGAIKVLAEQPGGSLTPFADWLGAATVPQAHLLGAIAGAAVGAVQVLRRSAQRD